MIHRVTSNDERFKTMCFQPGLNVILADVTDQSTDRDSRNGTGKSSLLQLFHFLLGGNVPTNSIFRRPQLAMHSFAMEIDLGDNQFSVVRSTSETRSYFVSQRAKINNPIDFPEADAIGQLPRDWDKFNLDRWKNLLGHHFYELGPDLPRFAPSARILLSYQIRNVNSGGFSTPFKYFSNQSDARARVAVSYFLGLDWAISAEFAKVLEDQKRIESLGKVARDPELGGLVGSTAELRTEIAIARQRADVLREQANQFTILENYEDFVQEADQLTRVIRDLRNEDAVDRDLMADIAAAEESEIPPGTVELERMWKQVNILLPDHVHVRYEQVKSFHESVIANRRQYLSRESDRASERISNRRVERRRADERRSEIMKLLSSSGALEQFAALEAEAARIEGDIRDLQRRFEHAELVERSKLETDGRLRELLFELQDDHRDRRDHLDRAIILFDEYSRYLYEDRHGSLIVRETLKGPEFDVDISAKGSVGIDSMQIFCFDMVVMTVMCERRVGPGFLVHDSHIFDGVDERQVANALMLGANLAEKHDFQYIVTMNSDKVPELPTEFGFDSFVNDVRLTDATSNGGLFGFRFD